MIARPLSTGIQTMRARPGLAVLLWAVQLTLAWLIATPVGAAIDASFSESGFGDEPLNAVLLVDFFLQNRGVVASLLGMLVAVFPVWLVWSALSGVGLAHALRDGGARSFWTGASSWFWPGLGVTAIFALVALVWTVVMAVLGLVLAAGGGGEVVVFWTSLVFVPTLWIFGLAAMDMMLDYARIGLAARDLSVIKAVFFGVSFPLRRLSAHLLYVVWFGPALLLAVGPAPLEAALGLGFLTFLIQQVLLLARQFVTIGWIGSEVALHEEVLDSEWGAIAQATATVSAFGAEG
ncbi:MAG: hypothetical protein JJ896_05200 [Rhodothermales bacterium]|nr:hypothetical protein [Rhodothermales bacterium]MBO6779030.1 hypothetical protein [Rhodothermales bacterium]